MYPTNQEKERPSVLTLLFGFNLQTFTVRKSINFLLDPPKKAEKQLFAGGVVAATQAKPMGPDPPARRTALRFAVLPPDGAGGPQLRAADAAHGPRGLLRSQAAGREAEKKWVPAAFPWVFSCFLVVLLDKSSVFGCFARKIEGFWLCFWLFC